MPASAQSESKRKRKSEDRSWISRQAAARRLCIDPDHIPRLAREGHIRAVRYPGVRDPLYSAEDCDRLMRECVVLGGPRGAA